jgi:hypothetical protein
MWRPRIRGQNQRWMRWHLVNNIKFVTNYLAAKDKRTDDASMVWWVSGNEVPI